MLRLTCTVVQVQGRPLMVNSASVSDKECAFKATVDLWWHHGATNRASTHPRTKYVCVTPLGFEFKSPAKMNGSPCVFLNSFAFKRR